MKTKIFMLLAILAMIAALIYGYVQMSQEQAAAAAADQPITAASRVARGTNNEAVITLDLETQRLIGLQTALLAAAAAPPEIKAYGRVLDPAPLVTLAGEIAADRAALMASGQEYQRLKTLVQGQNVSARALADAEAAAQHDQVTLMTAEAQLTGAWGQAVAGRTNLPAFVRSLARLKRVLVRLDVAAGEWPGQTPVGALVSSPAGDQVVAAAFLDRAATTDPQVQGTGFLFCVTNSPAWLTPGLNVTGCLQMPGQALTGVIVPEAAVIRSDARAWIYVQAGETNFVRREIMLDQADADGWFTTNAVAPGDKVVTIGAQVLLSEERKSEIKLAD